MTIDRTVGEAGRKMKDAISGLGDDVRQRLKQQAGNAMGAAQDIYGRAASRARDVAGDIDTMIEDRTYIALATAAVAGVAVGLILGLILAGRD